MKSFNDIKFVSVYKHNTHTYMKNLFLKKEYFYDAVKIIYK